MDVLMSIACDELIIHAHNSWEWECDYENDKWGHAEQYKECILSNKI